MPSTSETWYFEVVVRLYHDQTFSDLLNARKQTLGSCLDAASEISWACSQVESETLGLMHVEGFAHAGSSSKIHLESLHRLLPEGIMTAAGQVVRAIFENVLPGRGYTYKDSPRIKKFLEDSTLHQRAGKRLRVDYRGSSEVRWVCPSENNSKAWFWRGSMRCTDATHVKAIFTSKELPFPKW
jgi:hypothetical protein